MDSVIIDETRFNLSLFYRVIFFLVSKAFVKRDFRVFKQGLIYKLARKEIECELSKYSAINYDYLFVIKGYLLEASDISNICASKKVIYQWDMVYNYPLISGIYKEFDKIISFSFSDHIRYGFDFIPNFFVKNNKKLVNESEVGLFFIGEYSKTRYKYCCRVIQDCERIGLNYHISLVESSFKYHFLKVFDRYNILRKCNVARADYEKLLSNSKVILDLPKEEINSNSQRLLEGINSGKVILLKNRPEGLNLASLILLEELGKMEDISEFNEKSKFSFKDIEYTEQYELDNWISKVLF
ncbi:hypothetical protein ACTJ29_003575 [Vibrio vulnificus]